MNKMVRSPRDPRIVISRVCMVCDRPGKIHWRWVNGAIALICEEHELIDMGKPTRIEVLEFFYGNACYLCGGESQSADHVLPIWAFRTSMTENLRPSCRECNWRKGGMLPTEPILLRAKLPDFLLVALEDWIDRKKKKLGVHEIPIAYWEPRASLYSDNGVISLDSA